MPIPPDGTTFSHNIKEDEIHSPLEVDVISFTSFKDCGNLY
jgi:hypothetical protein